MEGEGESSSGEIGECKGRGVGVASQINPPSNFSHFPSRPLSDHPITSTDGSLDHPLEYVHISTQMENYFLLCQKLSNIKYSF